MLEGKKDPKDMTPEELEREKKYLDNESAHLSSILRAEEQAPVSDTGQNPLVPQRIHQIYAPDVREFIQKNGGRGPMPVIVSYADPMEDMRAKIWFGNAKMEPVRASMHEFLVRVYGEGGLLPPGLHKVGLVVNEYQQVLHPGGSSSDCFLGCLAWGNQVFWARVDLPRGAWKSYPIIIHPVDRAHNLLAEMSEAVLSMLPEPLQSAVVSL